MIKLIASDLDGTIIGSDNQIFENNFKAINDINSKKIDFVICTGKTYPITKGICSKFNASYGIFGNGNQIVDLKTGKEIYRKLLTRSEVLSCINIAKIHNLHVHIYTNAEIVTEKLEYMDLRNFILQKDNEESSVKITIVGDIAQYIENHDLEVCKLIISDNKDLENVKSEILTSQDISVITIRKYGEYKDTIINKEYEYLDIAPKNISKSTALNILGEYLQIEDNEIMAVGDNLNDLEMVKNSGIGVAVADAYDELKNVANYITTNSAEKGAFAEAVYKFIEF